MNFKVNAVILIKGVASDPVVDAYGTTTTSYDAGQGLVRETTDLVLHSEVSVEEFLKYWLQINLVHAKPTKSCVAMFNGWVRQDDNHTFTYEGTNRHNKKVNIQVSKEKLTQ
ncbi:hypothetical protein NVP1253O_50 [Vibrio phage 1.253.O._10N.286.45.B12]|nr:hypothetical protein NVP1235O_50 [Vibrio phage 1.235.O._10N.261.52.B2]AUR98574.1 hypothetical protein NVP1253O_50 [Vibrio phage 1.253.O._10N.286.45.B12]